MDFFLQLLFTGLGIGAVYALVLLVVVALCLTGLAARYRKASLS